MDETQTPQIETHSDPLEPEHVSTEYFNTDDNALMGGLIDRLKTKNTVSEVSTIDGKTLEVRVDDQGQVYAKIDKNDKPIEIVADETKPTAELSEIIEEVDDDGNKTKRKFVIGIVTAGAIIAGISAAKFVYDRSTKNQGKNI
jgi:hypothetical protein